MKSGCKKNGGNLIISELKSTERATERERRLYEREACFLRVKLKLQPGSMVFISRQRGSSAGQTEWVWPTGGRWVYTRAAPREPVAVSFRHKKIAPKRRNG